MWKLMKQLNKKEYLIIFICFIFICIQVYLDLLLPDYMSSITTLVQSEGSAFNDILIEGSKMLLCVFGSLIASVIVAAFAAKIASNFGGRIREKLFDKVQNFSLAEINHFSTASLITRSTNDVTQVQNLIVMGLQVVVKAPIMAVWAILKIADKSWQWTGVTGIAVAILLIVNLICILFAIPKFNKVQTLTDNVNKVARENLTGLSVVRAYNAEAYQEDKFEQANQELTKTNLFANSIMAILNPSIQFIMSGLTLAIYWIGAYLINNANMIEKINLFSDMVVFSTYAMQVVMAFMLMVIIFIMLPRSLVSAKRINEVLDTKITLKDGTVVNSPNNYRGEVEFRNVSFKYPDAKEYVLKNISFKAKKGDTIAFIGSTGSGKSTLINLIPRFYDATEGEVLVDGVNVKSYNQKALRNKLGYISQKAVLFKGTIRSNVDYGDNGKETTLDSDIVEAIYVAKANEFVETEDVGYDGYVSQNGSNFSGGQKQRLSIARAVCRRPEIFIFDDSFSALDYRTDKELRKALNSACKEATKLIVAQRIGTIIDANQIIVLDDGEVVGMGTHQELLKSCPVYQEIAYSQLSKEELENEK
ncbi:multidrug ABC transporter ATP-binding protein [Erysipelatoclostridium sp. An15]|uniref:ABC transporter ATP-binding protein n=1 Tax=Erysipelatoclostridium sp. An15 TaxID=1965566 RepID=UPI000B3973B5|nr:ABC transporter ATP-binding protein [Erysipelatoclostridium sp. An15]OUQ08187.1 multidrug ABC transporter ATP-binding protein [Erysipelatoclostridium sp. An15]